MLKVAGHRSHARSLWHNLLGRDVLEGRWTFQVVEGFDNDYYETARAEVHTLVDDLADGHRRPPRGRAAPPAPRGADLRSSTRTGDSQPIGAQM